MQQSFLFGSSRFSFDVLEQLTQRMSQLSDINEIVVYPAMHNDKESAVFLLITSDQEMCDGFIELNQIMLKDKRYHHLSASEVRYTAFCDSWTEFRDWINTLADAKLLQRPFVDIILVTPDWQHRLSHFENVYFSDIPMFITRLVRKKPLLVGLR